MGKSNIVRNWKDEHNLKYYFNCANSPDLSPIENCWQVPKQTVGRQPHWDVETTIVAIKQECSGKNLFAPRLRSRNNHRDYFCMI